MKLLVKKYFILLILLFLFFFSFTPIQAATIGPYLAIDVVGIQYAAYQHSNTGGKINSILNYEAGFYVGPKFFNQFTLHTSMIVSLPLADIDVGKSIRDDILDALYRVGFGGGVSLPSLPVIKVTLQTNVMFFTRHFQYNGYAIDVALDRKLESLGPIHIHVIAKYRYHTILKAISVSSIRSDFEGHSGHLGVRLSLF